MRFIKPIDSDIISRTAQRIKRFLVVEDNALQAGMGSCLLEVLSDINQGVEVKRLGIPDKFITYGKRNELLEDLGLSAQAIAGKVREWLK